MAEPTTHDARTSLRILQASEAEGQQINHLPEFENKKTADKWLRQHLTREGYDLKNNSLETALRAWQVRHGIDGTGFKKDGTMDAATQGMLLEEMKNKGPLEQMQAGALARLGYSNAPLNQPVPPEPAAAPAAAPPAAAPVAEATAPQTPLPPPNAVRTGTGGYLRDGSGNYVTSGTDAGPTPTFQQVAPPKDEASFEAEIRKHSGPSDLDRAADAIRQRAAEIRAGAADAGSRAANAAADMGGRAADKAGELSRDAAKVGGEAWDKLKGWGADAVDMAGGAFGAAKKKLHEATGPDASAPAAQAPAVQAPTAPAAQAPAAPAAPPRARPVTRLE